MDEIKLNKAQNLVRDMDEETLEIFSDWFLSNRAILE